MQCSVIWEIAERKITHGQIVATVVGGSAFMLGALCLETWNWQPCIIDTGACKYALLTEF